MLGYGLNKLFDFKTGKLLYNGRTSDLRTLCVFNIIKYVHQIARDFKLSMLRLDRGKIKTTQRRGFVTKE